MSERLDDMGLLIESASRIRSELSDLRGDLQSLATDRNLWRRIYVGLLLPELGKIRPGTEQSAEILTQAACISACDIAEVLLDELEKREKP